MTFPLVGLEARVLSRIWLKALLNLSSTGLPAAALMGELPAVAAAATLLGERPMVDLRLGLRNGDLGLRIADSGFGIYGRPTARKRRHGRKRAAILFVPFCTSGYCVKWELNCCMTVFHCVVLFRRIREKVWKVSGRVPVILDVLPSGFMGVKGSGKMGAPLGRTERHVLGCAAKSSYR